MSRHLSERDWYSSTYEAPEPPAIRERHDPHDERRCSVCDARPHRCECDKPKKEEG